MPANPITKQVRAPIDVTHHYAVRNREDMLMLPPEKAVPARSANLGVDLVKPGIIPITTIHTATENTAVRTNLTQDLDGIYATRNLGAVTPAQVVSGNNSRYRPVLVGRKAVTLGSLLSTPNLMIAAALGLAAFYVLKK